LPRKNEWVAGWVTKTFELANLFSTNRRNLIRFLIIVNLAGTAYGFFYYRYQLMDSNLVLWPLITDCPNASFLFALAALMIYFGRKRDNLSFFASANMVKYGIWTMAILLYHRDFFFAPERYLLYSGIFITHFFLVLEAIPLRNSISSIKRSGVAATLLWLLANDFFDYVLETHPYIPEKNIEYVAIFTVALTFFALFTVKKGLEIRG
jgi:uncharacterized membrane protein YpjA